MQLTNVSPPPPGPAAAPILRDKRLAAIGGFGVFALLAALSTDDGPVLCPFRRCTGGYCPGCGLTRSGGRLLRGDVAGSVQQHPYLIVGAVQAVLAALVMMLGPDRWKDRLTSSMMPILITNAALLTVIWVVRLMDGSIPVPFGG